MQSNNPVFRRSEEFHRGGATASFHDQAAPGQYQPYGQPQPGYAPAPPVATGGRMTIDTVVQKTAISLGVVIITAFATWIATGDIETTADLGPMFAALTVGSLGAFALSMVNSFKRQISPALVLLFCAFEGVALGALSKAIDISVADSVDDHGVVMGAVFGTFAAFAGTLAAYKFFNIRIGAKFQRFVIAAMFGMVGLGLMELVLGLFGAQLGLFGFGTLGLITAVVGLALGVFMLMMDFDFVEQGVANGLPEVESWRAAFAMTVSLVWIYTNLLRLLAILNDN